MANHENKNFIPVIPNKVREDLDGAGAASVDNYCTTVTAGGAVAVTLADVAVPGQVKRIERDDATGAITLTPTTFADGTSITIAAAKFNYAELMWVGDDGWRLIAGTGCTIVA